MDKGLLIAVSGFSGTGKGTIMKRIMDGSPEKYALSISATTREPREGEREGVEYFFKTKEEFEELIRKDQLIEYAEYVGNYYGTPRSYVYEQLEQGKDVFLEIEVQGALQVKKKFPETILVFVVPPSIEELVRRLRERGTESEEKIKKRLAQAKEEVVCAPEYDYILVNDNLEKAIKELEGIVSAEHHQSVYQKQILNRLQDELTGGIE